MKTYIKASFNLFGKNIFTPDSEKYLSLAISLEATIFICDGTMSIMAKDFFQKRKIPRPLHGNLMFNQKYTISFTQYYISPGA